MASAGRYAVGIGTGAASGAAAGSVIGPWGTAIGGALGAGIGALGTALGDDANDKTREELEEEQKRRRKELLLDYLRNRVAQSGLPTGEIDAMRAVKGLERQEGAENEALAARDQIDPMAFVGMAQQGAQAAGRTYNALNAPQPQQMQLGPVPQLPAGVVDQSLNHATQPGNYQLQLPDWLDDRRYRR